MPAHSHGITDPGHIHGITDAGHSHTVFNVVDGALTIRWNNQAGAFNQQNVATDKISSTETTGITINTNVTGISVNPTGSGASFDIRPQFMSAIYLIRVR